MAGDGVLHHPDLVTAKEKMLEARNAYLEYFRSDPDATTKNVVFGDLNGYEWYL